MPNRTKDFDCVAMKDRIQAELYEEFLRESSATGCSYVEFVRQRASQSSYVQEMTKRFTGTGEHVQDG